MTKIMEVCGLCFIIPEFIYFKIWLLSDHEDSVVFLNVQLNLVCAAFSTDARDSEAIDAGDLCRGDHSQVDHSICRK